MPITDNLIAYWNLDEASGQRNDSGPNGLHFTPSASAPTGTTGPGGHNATLFASASAQYLYHDDDPLFGSNLHLHAFTLTAWVRPVSWPQDYTGIIHYGGNYAVQGLDMYANVASNPTYSVNIYSDGSASTGVNATNFGAIPLSPTWTFLTLTQNADGSVVRVGVNAVAGNYQSGNLGFTVYDAAGQRFSLAQRQGVGQYSFNGAMAMVGFWGRELSDAEITQVFNSGNGLSWTELGAGAITRAFTDVYGLYR